jgi:hypothetical protein
MHFIRKVFLIIVGVISVAYDEVSKSMEEATQAIEAKHGTNGTHVEIKIQEK